MVGEPSLTGAAFHATRGRRRVPHCSGMAVSGGIGGIGLLPAFTLPRPEGGCVHSWDYKGRTALVIWLLAGQPPSDPALVACAESYPRLRDEQAELLVVQVGPPRAPSASGGRLPGVLLVDRDGSIHRRLAAAGPTLLVADRDGAIYWRSPIEDVPDFAEALSWLAYINLLEPECGCCAPCWPDAEPGPP